MSALRSGKHDVDGGKNPGSVFLERIECSGCGKTFQHAFVYGTRIDARRKVRETGEFSVPARGYDRFNGLLADALERCERIDDRIAVNFKVDRRAVDRRWVDQIGRASCRERV